MKANMLIPLLRRSFTDWIDDDAPRLGAALAFYAILSISPLVILGVAIVSLVFDRSSAQAHLLSQVQAFVGPDGRHALESMLASGHKTSSGIFATIVGFLTLIFGASGVFGELRSALNTIWKVKPESRSGLWGMVRERFFSFGMVMSVGFVLLVSLLASTALAAMTKFFGSLLPITSVVLGVSNFLVSFAGIAVLFGFILKYVPETKVEWSEVRLGATGTAFLFTVGKSLLGLYLGKASPGSAYGAAGSLVVMVIWVYYSAQIFFFGAEFTHVYGLFKRGALPPAKDGLKTR